MPRGAATLAILAVLLLPGCGGSDIDPVTSFEAFSTEMAKNAQAQEPQSLPSGIVAGDAVRFGFDGTSAYDVVETDSLVTPYEGKLVLDLVWIADGEIVDHSDIRLEATYGWRDGEWELLSADRCYDFMKSGEWTCDRDPSNTTFWFSVLQGIE